MSTNKRELLVFNKHGYDEAFARLYNIDPTSTDLPGRCFDRWCAFMEDKPKGSLLLRESGTLGKIVIVRKNLKGEVSQGKYTCIGIDVENGRKIWVADHKNLHTSYVALFAKGFTEQDKIDLFSIDVIVDGRLVNYNLIKPTIDQASSSYYLDDDDDEQLAPRPF